MGGRQSRSELYTKVNDVLAENGYARVTRATTAADMPSHFGSKRMAKAFFEAVNYLEPPMPERQKADIYAKKFTIADGAPYSRYERKQMSLFNPENPFPTEGSEGEDRVFAWLDANKSKVGLARGGKYQMFTSQSKKKFF